MNHQSLNDSLNISFKIQYILALLVLNCFLPSNANAQLEKILTYKTETFTINYPASWKMTKEKDILNFFPADDYGALTLSSYKNTDLTSAQLKPFIVEMYEGKVKETSIITIQNGVTTTCSYEYTDAENIKWVAKAMIKSNTLFLVTINCVVDKWATEKAAFLQVMDSFKLK